MASDWNAATVAWKQLGCPYEQAIALFDGDEAAEKTALAIFKRLGATSAAELARNKMRAEDIRGIPRGPRAAAKRNPAGLTPRELEILILVAEGLQNVGIATRLFVSSKAIDHQVSVILAKLHVRICARRWSLPITSKSCRNTGSLPSKHTHPPRCQLEALAGILRTM